MFAGWQLISISIGYIGLLFLIAYIGDKYRHKRLPISQPLIYALTLGVYCTSWSFLGTPGQAATNLFSYLPIYLGPILLFVFAWPFIQRIIRVSLKLNLTSIADLLAARFGKSHLLAVIVTLVALIGTLPYIALQLKAIVYSYQHLQGDLSSDPTFIGLAVSLLLGGFTIAFGIRTIDVTERHPGVMLAVAFESIVKLIAFLTTGLFVVFVLYDSPMQLWQQSNASAQLDQLLQWPNISAMVGSLIIVMAAFLTLPRQFQVMVVELRKPQDSQLSRIIFPLYLLIFALFAAPLGLAGQLLLGDSVPPDTYVLFLPALENQLWLTLFAFLGAVSAASAMVIIAAIALSIMLSNEIVFPLLFRKQNNDNSYARFRIRLLMIRKLLVLTVIMLGYGVFLAAPPDTLASLGEVAFGAVAQLTPALIAAFYWRKANLTGVIGGITVGFSFWLLLNFLPQFGLYPQPLSNSPLPVNTTATLISLLANVWVLIWLSQLSRQSVQESIQANHFIPSPHQPSIHFRYKKKLNASEMQLLASRFVGEDKAIAAFVQFFSEFNHKNTDTDEFNQALIQRTENTLGSVMGASSAQLVVSSTLQGKDIALDQIALLVEEASSQRLQFSHSLLHSAIENAADGISVIDNQQKLVAWNKRYREMFNFPEAMLTIGSPVEQLIRFNAERGLCGTGDLDRQVAKRIQYLKEGSPHSTELNQPNGQIIRIEGNPLPDNGFVMIFSDVTTYRQAEQVLRETNQDLETRVQERTQKLEQSNQQLEHTNRELDSARAKAELSHQKKSQTLKACSHDLMQPLEAARLFTSALSHQKGLNASHKQQIDNIEHSLKSASALLSELGDIARIEGGNINVNIKPFAINDLFDDISKEFSAHSTSKATKEDVTFRCISSSLWVNSDQKLLSRILQNLVSNAFRYAAGGKIVLGCRRKQDQLSIEVIDNGPGIAADKQQMVFEQFTQLDTPQAGNNTSKGLGLGLSIAKSFSQLLGHPLALQSSEGRGCRFSITVPTAIKQQVQPQIAAVKPVGLQHVTVLCIDNDPDVLGAMIQLLQAWQCQIFSADSFASAQQVFSQHGDDIDIILADYQLTNQPDAEHNGLTLLSALQGDSGITTPGILITATTDGDVKEQTITAGFSYMKKPVKPAALRALISATLAKQLQRNYLD
ncbi:MAG: Na+/proline symporter/signal transduction histidine kinase/CheY-like chemotaxis protein [Phenylobacterium sp.]|jgi:Na+/proline symporter/signal transduction histidine kinase/CheY-like chemotaxis protein